MNLWISMHNCRPSCDIFIICAKLGHKGLHITLLPPPRIRVQFNTLYACILLWKPEPFPDRAFLFMMFLVSACVFLSKQRARGAGGRAASALCVLLTLFLSSHFPFLNRGRQRPWPPPRRSVGEHHLCRADRTPDTRPWDGARSESTLFRKEGRRCCLLCIWKGSLYFKYPIRTTTLLSLTNNWFWSGSFINIAIHSPVYLTVKLMLTLTSLWGKWKKTKTRLKWTLPWLILFLALASIK